MNQTYNYPPSFPYQSNDNNSHHHPVNNSMNYFSPYSAPSPSLPPSLTSNPSPQHTDSPTNLLWLNQIRSPKRKPDMSDFSHQPFRGGEEEMGSSNTSEKRQRSELGGEEEDYGGEGMMESASIEEDEELMEVEGIYVTTPKPRQFLQFPQRQPQAFQQLQQSQQQRNSPLLPTSTITETQQFQHLLAVNLESRKNFQETVLSFRLSQVYDPTMKTVTLMDYPALQEVIVDVPIQILEISSCPSLQRIIQRVESLFKITILMPPPPTTPPPPSYWSAQDQPGYGGVSHQGGMVVEKRKIDYFLLPQGRLPSRCNITHADIVIRALKN